MKKIDFKINKSDGYGLMHDSRSDIKTLSKVVNHLIDKVNELIEENEYLNHRISNISSSSQPN